LVIANIGNKGIKAMLTTETRPIEQQTDSWQPHPTSLGKWHGWKGYLPVEEYIANEQYKKGYFEGIEQRYLTRPNTNL
jgi:hypothetical protein